jgi:hypothetical protein
VVRRLRPRLRFPAGLRCRPALPHRRRTGDLQALVAKLPQLIGLGIDEATAAIVQGSVLEVVGDSKLAVFDQRPLEGRTQPATTEPQWLEPGMRWDLVRGKGL